MLIGAKVAASKSRGRDEGASDAMATIDNFCSPRLIRGTKKNRREAHWETIMNIVLPSYVRG